MTQAIEKKMISGDAAMELIAICDLCDSHNIGSAIRPDGVVRIDLGLRSHEARNLQEAERVLSLYGYR